MGLGQERLSSNAIMQHFSKPQWTSWFEVRNILNRLIMDSVPRFKKYSFDTGWGATTENARPERRYSVSYNVTVGWQMHVVTTGTR